MPTIRAAVLLAGAAGVAILLSCCSHSNPVEPDYSAFAVDSVIYKCGRWFPAPPEQSRGLFDIFLSFDYTEDGMEAWRDHGMEPWQRHMVESAGGVIIHEFHVPVVRVLIEAADLPPMNKYARGVTDIDDYPVRLTFMFKSAITQEDRDFLLAMGARDLEEYALDPFTTPEVMVAVVPDGGVPAVLAWDRLVYVETNESLICPAKPGR